MIEVIALCGFVFGVACKLPPALTILVMNGCFCFPIGTYLIWVKSLKKETQLIFSPLTKRLRPEQGVNVVAEVVIENSETTDSNNMISATTKFCSDLENKTNNASDENGEDPDNKISSTSYDSEQNSSTNDKNGSPFGDKDGPNEQKSSTNNKNCIPPDDKDGDPLDDQSSSATNKINTDTDQEHKPCTSETTTILEVLGFLIQLSVLVEVPILMASEFKENRIYQHNYVAVLILLPVSLLLLSFVWSGWIVIQNKEKRVGGKIKYGGDRLKSGRTTSYCVACTLYYQLNN